MIKSMLTTVWGRVHRLALNEGQKENNKMEG